MEIRLEREDDGLKVDPQIPQIAPIQNDNTANATPAGTKLIGAANWNSASFDRFESI